MTNLAPGYKAFDLTDEPFTKVNDSMTRAITNAGGSIHRYTELFWNAVGAGLRAGIIIDALLEEEYKSTLVSMSERDTMIDLRAWGREASMVSAFLLNTFDQALISETTILASMYIVAPQLDNQLIHAWYAKWAFENKDFFIPKMQTQ